MTVDLTNCDREPIPILGAIQPIGFLVALTADWMVAQVSQNIATYMPTSPEDALGMPPLSCSLRKRSTICATAQRYSVARTPWNGCSGLELTPDGARFDVALHSSGGQVVIENETAFPGRMAARP